MSAEQLDALQTTYRQVFNSVEGQQILQDLQRRYHINATTFERGDPHYSAFLEGQREVVLTIMRMVKERKATPTTED
jgi:hypothetical protein